MGNLRDEIAALSRKTGYICTVETWLRGQKDRAEWEDVLGDPTLQSAAIWRAMTSHGYTFKTQSLTRHRRGDCTCGKSPR